VEESQKFLLTVVVVLLIIGAIGGGLYWEWTTLGAARAELARKQQEEAKQHELIDKDIPRLKEELASKTEKVAEYEKTLHSAKEIEDMDETLNNYKVQAGVRLIERRPVQETGSEAAKAQQPLYYKYSYRLALAADFFSWATFVNLLENHARFIRVDEFDAKPSTKEPGILDVTMKISTFSYAKVEQPKAAPSGSATTPAPTGPSGSTATPAPTGPPAGGSAPGSTAAPAQGAQP
jgi:Tfp pilus assembly protein PilO